MLCLPGCSTVKLAYNNAQTMSYWWLDSYFDFDAAQSEKVRADLAALQAWHRARQLPAYVNTLEKLQRAAPANVTPEQVCDLLAELKSHAQVLIDQTEPTLAALAPTLTEEQLAHLARQLDKRSRKWHEEWLDGSPAERQARRLKKLAERADMLYGPLEEAQLKLLRTHVAASAFDAASSWRESQRRHQDTLQTLRQIKGGSLDALQVRAALHALLARAITSPDPAYRTYTEKLNQENCRTYAALHNSSTPAQRIKLLDTLKDYAADARALMAAGLNIPS
jgi:hypothetical protein